MQPLVKRISDFIHHRFLILLLLAHLVALLFPGFGQWIRSVHLGKTVWLDGSGLEITLPVVMLSFLLFNAGLGIKIKEVKHLKEKPGILWLGLLANLAVPLCFTLLLLSLNGLWHNPTEIQNILVGLALIGSMPIAGSSTAWAQNANGNLVLSLGLVVLSTVLSPFTTPWILHAFGWMTTGDFSEDLHELASSGVNAFLAFSVVLPSLFGIITHFALGERRVNQFIPYLKLLGSLNLLILIYSNAAIALPQAFAKPDWDFLLLILIITISLCLVAFSTGWVLSKLLHTSQKEQASLMFGLGMNNNGTGLVLSSMMLKDHPMVMLPIIFYNLVQQIAAGIVDTKILKK